MSEADYRAAVLGFLLRDTPTLGPASSVGGAIRFLRRLFAG